ncbi:hypothetical protein GCM10010251_16840 [Streptomyces aurantiogriseus]|uniref:Uncharacterized protein n=2 Tax=Streptomyces aurantiogriseus TaxID=66870 RepID=A0A918F2Q0_9ACTN|nr:hypothetical protein GCM10010251_16840 [Streptomyces aurantiogriseus]
MSASVSLAMTHLTTLAKEVDEDKVTPGVLGFIVFAVMAIAVWGLMKSMNKHMGKVDFTEAPEDTDTAEEGTSGKGAPGKTSSAKG